MNDLDAVEISIEDAKEAIGTMESLIKLQDNSDFKKIILDGYFKEEASRLVLFRALPQVTEEMRVDIDAQIAAVGNFRQYLSTIFSQGNMARNGLASHEATREEILAEAV